MFENPFNTSHEIVMMGDFNIDFKRDVTTRRLHVLDNFNLCQLVTSPTRITVNSETIIDHVYSTNVEKNKSIIVSRESLSDHFPVYFSIILKYLRKDTKESGIHKQITYRQTKKIDWIKFTASLAECNWNILQDILNPDKALETWHEMFMSVLDKHAPIKQKRVKRTKKTLG